MRFVRLLSLAIGGTLLIGSAAAEQRLVARLSGFTADKVRHTDVRVTRPVRVLLEGTGAGSGKGSLHSYGWLIDATSGKLAWSMQKSDTTVDPRAPRSHRASETLTLEPGDYRLYYFAGGGHGMLRGTSFKRLFGTHGKAPRTADYQVSLSVDEADRDAVTITRSAPTGASSVRLAPLGDNSYVRKRFRITDDAVVDLLALGEMLAHGKMMADSCWLIELRSRKPVWQMDANKTEHAGGAHKNRLTRSRLELKAGLYEIAASTDDSHSVDDWNALPPHAPDSWGITLTAPPGVLDFEVPDERTIVRLQGVYDSERHTARFRLDRAADIRVYALGEWDSSDGSLADYAWIARADTGKEVWRQRYEGSSHAGGDGKNRLSDLSIRLPAGEYRVGYVSDDSHSAERFNKGPPLDELAWGVKISTFDPTVPFEVLDFVVEQRDRADRRH